MTSGLLTVGKYDVFTRVQLLRVLHTDGINVLVQCNAIIYALIVSRLQIFSHLPIARHDESMYERKSTQSASNVHRRRVRAYVQVMQLYMPCMH